MKKKECSRCKEVKDITLFSIDKRYKYGVFGVCKECQKIYNKQYRDKNKDVLSSKKKKWIKENYSRYKANMIRAYIKYLNKNGFTVSINSNVVVIGGTTCPKCNIDGLFKIEDGYRCEECLSVFDENKIMITNKT